MCCSLRGPTRRTARSHVTDSATPHDVLAASAYHLLLRLSMSSTDSLPMVLPQRIVATRACWTAHLPELRRVLCDRGRGSLFSLLLMQDWSSPHHDGLFFHTTVHC